MIVLASIQSSSSFQRDPKLEFTADPVSQLITDQPSHTILTSHMFKRVTTLALLAALPVTISIFGSNSFASETTNSSVTNESSTAPAVKASAGEGKAQVSVHEAGRDVGRETGHEAGQNSAQTSNGKTAEAKAADGDSDRVPAGLTQLLGASQYYSPYAFVVDKKARVLSVWQQTEAGLKKVAAFPADLGKHSGNKQNRGDAKTPEGIYFLQTRLEGSALDFNLYGKRAFTTDYPNYFDRLQGKTGSGIWLHAVPDHVALTRGSSGCVVVRNDVILNLTQYVRLGRTPILIQNQTDFEPLAAQQKDNVEVTEWLESWRDAWEKKDLENYIAHYGDGFNSMKMNKQQWHDYKAKLNDEYHTITVHISKPSVFFSNGNGIVRFLQEYASDQHTDFGEKVLYVKKDSKGIHIIGETWAPESSKIAKDEIENSAHATNAQSNGKNGASSTGITKPNTDSRLNAGNQ